MVTSKLASSLPNEEYQILHDSCHGFQDELYFIAASGFWVFIEKFLRNKLILFKVQQGDGVDLLTLINQVEEEIEEEQYSIPSITILKDRLKNTEFYKSLTGEEKSLVTRFANNKWMLPNMVNELILMDKLTKSIGDLILGNYQKHRNAIQHGVYKKLYGVYEEELLIRVPELLKTPSIVIGSFSEDNHTSETRDVSGGHLFIRSRRMGGVMKLTCEDSIELIYELLVKFETT